MYYNHLNSTFVEGSLTAIPYKHHTSFGAWLVVINDKKARHKEILSIYAMNGQEASQIAIKQYPGYVAEQKLIRKLIYTKSSLSRKTKLAKKNTEAEKEQADLSQKASPNLESGGRKNGRRSHKKTSVSLKDS